MTEQHKTALAVLLLSLPLWLGPQAPLYKGLENFFFGLELSRNPQYLTAQVQLQQEFLGALPLKKRGAAPLELSSSSALSVLVKESGGESRVLFEKNSEQKFGIASLSKLVGALVVARNIPLEREIEISREAVLEEENFGQLREGEAFLARDLLYPMLMESSNDASAAFALELGKENFLNLMNQQARALGMQDTFFANHAGLDPDILQGAVNYSSANDVFLLTRHLKTYYASVFDILGQQKRDLYTADGRLHHAMENTNQLLSSNGWPTKVLGGKTGWTPQARGALVLVLESPRSADGYIVNIVLGSENRFSDMRELVNWVFAAHRF